MKRIIISLLIAFLLFTGPSYACVGKVLNIGILNSVNENLLAELVSVLINERTGMTVNIRVYGDSGQIYEAVKRDELGMVVEDTGRALKILNMPDNGDNVKAYDLSRKEFRDRMDLIWLKPFGAVKTEDGAGQYYYAPVITGHVLINFPALPRLINKLSDIAADKSFREMTKAVKADGQAGKAAKNFLKKKKLI
ncbi:MAG: hypothetical protein HZA16_00905 [Nitrospirae bacterium]|nr:hypothetical protein [Nitrospirota bacterium]